MTAVAAGSAEPFSERRRLGEFIRLRRERLSAASAGFAAGRRRTPGLRREEVAALASVSATWITWLEQGRAVSASAPVLARLADALQLSAAERAYLFDLAGRRDPASPPAGPHASDALLGSVHVMQCPAYVLDRQWNIVSANARAAQDAHAGRSERRDDAAFERYRAAIIEFVGRYWGQRLGEVQVGKVLLDMLGILRRHRVRVNPSFTIVNIAIAVTEGIGKQLDPELDLMSEALPYFLAHPTLGTSARA